MPLKFQRYGELWQELNPEANVHDWTEEEIMDTKWINQKVIDQMYHESRQPGADVVAFYTHVADVVDYELVYINGGWYFNTDLKPIRPLSDLVYDPDLPAFAYEDDVHLVNMAMYGPAGDQFFGTIIEQLPQRYFSMPGAFMNASTGVQLIMQAYSRWGRPVQGFNRNVFNPIHWSEFDYGQEPDTEKEYGPETIAVHEWGHRTNQRGQRILES